MQIKLQEDSPHLIHIVDIWIIADNSGKRLKFIVQGAEDKLFIKDVIVWDELKEKHNRN
jgi:hypothetical protein